jgi:hypothetical protein
LCERKKETEEQKRRKVEKKPNGARRWGGQTVQTPRFPFLGLQPLRFLDSLYIAIIPLKWLIKDVSMAHLVVPGPRYMLLCKNPPQAPQTAPSASANLLNYGKSV